MKVTQKGQVLPYYLSSDRRSQISRSGSVKWATGNVQVDLRPDGENMRLVHKGNDKSVKVATFNVRTLYKEGKIHNADSELDRLDIDIMGISEVRLRGSGREDTQHGTLFYSGSSMNDKKHQYGVATLVNRRLSKFVSNFIPFSDRCMLLQIKAYPVNLNIIQIFAPTLDKDDDEIEIFYEDVNKVLKATKRNDMTIVMGDFNAKIGKGQQGNIVGGFGLGVRNVRGDRLVQFCEEHEMCITNTFFQHPARRLYTWKSPQDGHNNNIVRNQIDFILANNRYLNAFKNVKTYPGADIESDHNPVVAQIRLKLKKPTVKKSYRRIYIKRLKDSNIQRSFSKRLNDDLNGVQVDNSDIDETWLKVRDTINDIFVDELGYSQKEKRQDWMTDDILTLMRIRAENKQNLTKYRELQKKIKLEIKKAKEQWLNSKYSGIGLFDFLVEAELQHYYNPIRNDLKILKTAQLKYVTDEDLIQLGMSKPEQRRLKKYYSKYFSPNYLSKIKKLLGPGKKDENQTGLTSLTEESLYTLQTVDNPQDHIIKMPSDHVIPTENITINKELGIGEFGVVQQGVWTNDGIRIQVAVKCLSKEKMNTNSMEFLKEAAIMHNIDHKNIVRLYGVVIHMDTLMLVTELAPLRALSECLKEVSLRTSFPVLTLCDFASQICDGMAYLENKRLIHRDLAARNILVFSKNKVKISDFGLSRALGVGKNYYQTNINVNLKLPIAWCAPECISFLRFTSASDVWAFAVTLWEMFSYGFQPWAGFSGYQILVAIDSPNFQRLEQPECCPQQYYALMQKCWSCEPTKRPKFSEILNMLPDCKPEQVQAITSVDIDANKRSDQLIYRVGDVITILEKATPGTSQWKGVLNTGATGYFSPSNVVPLDSNSPPLSVNQTSSNSFARSSLRESSTSGNSFRNSLLRSQGRFSSKRRLCVNMISGPQGDVKHTAHLGVDGVHFGEFPSFEHTLIPKQIVNPYKPSDDLEQTPLIHPNSPSHLTGNNSTNPPAKSSEFSKFNSDSENNKHGASSASGHFNLNFDSLSKTKWPSQKNNFMTNSNTKSHNDVNDFDEKDSDQPHEYQEIIDSQKISDFGQSLMDELDSIYYSHRSNASTSSNQDHEGTNHRNELTELSSRTNNSTLTKKKQTIVKPLSTDDQIMLDSAIALYNVMSTKSMTDLEHKEQPLTPTTPNDKENKFFRLPLGEHSGHHSQSHKTSHLSSRSEKRTFSQEVQSVPDIQSSLTEESRIAYESLVEQPVRLETTLLGIREKQGKHVEGSVRTLPRLDTVDAPRFHSSSEVLSTSEQLASDNPLPLPPRDRTIHQAPRKRHTRIHPLIIQGSNLKRTLERVNADLSTDHTVLSTVQNAQQYLNTDSHTSQISLSSVSIEKPVRNSLMKSESCQTSHYQNVGIKLPMKDEDCFDTASLKFEAQVENDFASVDTCDGGNADFECESKSSNVISSDDEQVFIQSRHLGSQKNSHVLNLNNVTNLEYIDGDDRISIREHISDNGKRISSFSKNGLPLPPIGDFSKLKLKTELYSHDTVMADVKDNGSTNSLDKLKTPSKDHQKEQAVTKTRSKSVDDDDAYPIDSQHLARGSPDRVSVEDLLKFADQKPCGRQRGTESDEVRIMCKVLNHQVSAETCLNTLEFVSWNVHRAIKLARLRASAGGELHECFAALNACSWDVSRAALLLMGHGDITQV